MNLNLKLFVLASIAVVSLTGSTTAAEGSNQLRGGSDYASTEIGRHLVATYTPPDNGTNANALYGSNSGGGNTGSTYTPPPDTCPVQITLDSRGGEAINSSCRDVGGGCRYTQDNKKYAQCNCEQTGNSATWYCFPDPADNNTPDDDMIMD